MSETITLYFTGFIIAFPFGETLLILYSNIHFLIWFYYANAFAEPFYQELISFIKLKGFRSLPLCFFTINFGIPNIIFINNDTGSIFNITFYALLLYFGSVFPPAFLLYIAINVLIIESIVFGNLIHNKKFKDYFVYIFFQGDNELAEKYIFVFFGNPGSKGLKHFYQMVAATGFVTTCAITEDSYASLRAQEEFSLLIKSQQFQGKSLGIDEFIALKRDIRASLPYNNGARFVINTGNFAVENLKTFLKSKS